METAAQQPPRPRTEGEKAGAYTDAERTRRFIQTNGNDNIVLIKNTSPKQRIDGTAAHKYDEEVLFTINYRDDLTTACFVE